MTTKHPQDMTVEELAAELAEFETFYLSDQPTTCPHCGTRTDWTDLSNGVQRHTCLNTLCGFEFLAEEYDGGEDAED